MTYKEGVEMSAFGRSNFSLNISWSNDLLLTALDIDQEALNEKPLVVNFDLKKVCLLPV